MTRYLANASWVIVIVGYMARGIMTSRGLDGVGRYTKQLEFVLPSAENSIAWTSGAENA